MTTPTYRTEQEAFWAGSFGDEYIGRNASAQLAGLEPSLLRNDLCGWLDVPSSCIEFGANIGMNLRALQMLYPGIEMHGLEINAQAASELAKVVGQERAKHTSIFDYTPSGTFDLALIKGVLIHLDPSMLPSVYDKLVASTHRWLMLAEYYNPSPVAIPYRGHTDRLFKRDFAGEILERHPQLRLADYGFAYRRDAAFPQDDITWFLLEKRI